METKRYAIPVSSLSTSVFRVDGLYTSCEVEEMNTLLVAGVHPHILHMK
jgi:hypothetical protein